MTMRTYVRCWWRGDPNVLPCPACGCPLQTPDRTPMATTLAAHYDVVHPGVLVPELVESGAS